MKFKLLALTLCLATLSCLNLNAQAQKVKKPNIAKNTKNPRISPASKLLSKDSADFYFFEASDTNPFVFTGSSVTPPNFVPLPFTQQKLSHGQSIKPNATGTQFLLEKGTYLVLFTGTFQTDLTISPTEEGIFFDIALQLGPNAIFINTDSGNPLSGDGFGDFASPISLCCTSKVVEVDKPTNLAVVVSGTVDNTVITTTTRSITIVKL